MGLVAGLWAGGLPSPGRGRAAVISPAADKMCQNYFPIIQQMKLTKNIIEWPCWYIINEEGKPGPVPGLSWHKPSLRAAAASSPPPPGHPYRTPLHNKNISLESVKILRRSVKITGPQQLSCFHISWRYFALGTGPLHTADWVGWREHCRITFHYSRMWIELSSCKDKGFFVDWREKKDYCNWSCVHRKCYL